MPKVLFLAFLLAHSILTFSQNSVLEPENEQKKDSLVILIIPYNPVYYLSDSDGLIAEASGKNVATIREIFRSSLDQALKKQFGENHFAHSVLTDTSVGAHEDLSLIYKSQILKYEDSPSYKKQEKKMKNVAKTSSRGFGINKSSVTADVPFLDNLYMNVSFTDPDLLSDLSAWYQNDYFIFLNQFEIRIDYTDCLDLERKIYNRHLKVHYSIYNNKGEFVSGDYVKVVFPSDRNHVNEIISRNFPALAKQLSENIY